MGWVKGSDHKWLASSPSVFAPKREEGKVAVEEVRPERVTAIPSKPPGMVQKGSKRSAAP